MFPILNEFEHIFFKLIQLGRESTLLPKDLTIKGDANKIGLEFYPVLNLSVPDFIRYFQPKN
jgi:hypothetical protein